MENGICCRPSLMGRTLVNRPTSDAAVAASVTTLAFVSLTVVATASPHRHCPSLEVGVDVLQIAVSVTVEQNFEMRQSATVSQDPGNPAQIWYPLGAPTLRCHDHRFEQTQAMVMYMERTANLSVQLETVVHLQLHSESRHAHH